MTAGPGTLKEATKIDLDERSRNDPRYVAYYAKIQDTIREEVQRANRQSSRTENA
jgi:hypothetical protein